MLWKPKAPAIIHAPAEALDRYGNLRIGGGLPSRRRMLMAAAGASGGILPSDIANLIAWHRADLGITKDGGDLVSQWDDQSASGYDLTQGTGSKQPLWLSAEVNGQDALRFDGSDDFIARTGLSLAQPNHCFLVFLQDTWVSSDNIVEFHDSSDLIIEQKLSGSSPQVVQQAGGSRGNLVSPTLDTWYLLQSCFDGASAFQALNDDSSSSGTSTGAAAFNRIGIGGYRSPQYTDIDVAEFAIYSAVISGADLTSLKNYFNDRYNLW